MNADMRTPVSVLTGFLGSGKTTVLNHLLHRPELAGTAVIINEFGSVGIDHLLVDHVAENMRLLASGCLCCTVRGDLVDTLGLLAERRARGEIGFARVVIETTGLADPAPVLHTLMADPALTPSFRLDGVVTTVDAVNAAGTLERHAEAVKQVAVADRLLLTKTDLV
ncbi:MAG TPA: GTP-binding protein, partial [Burkholderiaceae bacterium]|nr:GTP-binding protein [Burkholderiaceae bacterium]